MKRVQQQSIERADCGVACVAMLADRTYQEAFEAFGFPENQSQFYTRHHHLISALGKLGCTVERKRFRSWRTISGRAIVAVNHSHSQKYRCWHWVTFDGEAIIDPKPGRKSRKTDFRGLRGKGQCLVISVS